MTILNSNTCKLWANLFASWTILHSSAISSKDLPKGWCLASPLARSISWAPFSDTCRIRSRSWASCAFSLSISPCRICEHDFVQEFRRTAYKVTFCYLQSKHGPSVHLKLFMWKGRAWFSGAKWNSKNVFVCWCSGRGDLARLIERGCIEWYSEELSGTKYLEPFWSWLLGSLWAVRSIVRFGFRIM